MSEKTGRLRVATYLVPSIRVQFFEFVTHYLEETLKKPVTLIYESRGHGGFVDGHGDPFEQDECDIAFVSSTAYYQLESRKIKGADLLPISTVHRHAGSGQDESGQDVAGVYVDVITHADAAERIKEFIDLRGCNWVVTHADSLTTSLLAQQKLKKLGETLSFFGSILTSEHHAKSIQMVLMKQATAAAVDGNALSMWRTRNPRLSNEIATVDKWGPLPPYAVLVNKNMSAETRDAVKSALLKMNEQEGWKEKLMRYSVVGFKEITPDVFQEEGEIKEYVQGMGLRDHVTTE